MWKISKRQYNFEKVPNKLITMMQLASPTHFSALLNFWTISQLNRLFRSAFLRELNSSLKYVGLCGRSSFKV